MIVNLDGAFVPPEQACIPVGDSALLFGDSLFETLKAFGRRIRFLPEHLDRLSLSARLLEFPADRARLHQALLETAERLPWPVSRLRLTLTRGDMAGFEACNKTGRFVIAAVPYREPDAAERQAGAACLWAPNQRVNPLSHLPQMKRGNYADCLYAARFARRHGAREALFRTGEGEVLEGATSNLFLIRDGRLLTPPAGDLVLAGILRRQTLLAAAELGLPALETAVTETDLLRADEAFLSNALIDLLPVASVAGQALPRGPWAERLRRHIRQNAKAP
jgi:branched-chain amino acid aminotransferase